jgi:hypothetical protein
MLRDWPLYVLGAAVGCGIAIVFGFIVGWLP